MVDPTENERLANEVGRLREQIAHVRQSLLEICDGSNWPEYAQSGDGYKAYSEITEQLHEIVPELSAK